MPFISERGKKIPASPIRKLVPFADAAKKRGVKVYHLNIGQPDIKTPEIAIEAIQNTKLKVIEYSPSNGFLSYRQRLVSYYKSVGIEVNENEMLVTTGGSEAVLFAFLSCINPGEEVIIPEPYYANYNGFAIQTGVVVKPIVSSIKNDFALPAIEEFEKIITPKTRGIMICNPNNPTGYLYSKEELEKLAILIKKYDLYLFADEVYREFCYDGEKHFSAMNLKGLEQNVILLDSVSKRYSMCGVRIGVVISHNCDVINTAMRFAQARLCPPTFGQIASEAAIDTSKEYFTEVYNEYIERRNFMVNELNKMPGVYCPMPKGAFYAVASFPVDNADKFCEWLLTSFNYNNQTLMMAPASGFYSNPLLGANECRLAYVLKIDDLRNAMQVLAEALKVYPGKIIDKKEKNTEFKIAPKP